MTGSTRSAGSRGLRTLTATGTALLLAALTAASAAQPQTPDAKLKWRSVGPAIGGRVVAVAGVPGERDLFYMGGVDGGVWKSTDYGVKWVNITDGKLPGWANSIGAIAVAPSNPKVIYAGTGESDIRGDVITGDGMFRSDDAGKTWHAIGLADTHTISAIVIDPHDPDIVYASSMGHVFKSNSDRGVYKSTDGGRSWKKILYVDDKTGAIDLVMDPRDPRVLYAALWQAYRTPWKLDDGGPGSGLYKSTDGGAHWSEISHNPGFAQGILGRVGVTFAGPDSNIVYAIVQAKHGGVFRSSDGGASWKRVNASWSLRQRAFYYMAIYGDPKDANTVYAPNVDALWVSHDGGKSFSKLRTPHGDNHIVWINPNDTRVLLEGNDGGATVSTDGGKTWSDEHNQPTGQFYHVALDEQFPFHIYGAQQDEGSFEGPSATPGGMIPVGDWQRVAYGESTFVAPVPGHPDVTYGSGYFSILLRYDMITGQYQEVSPWPEYQEGAPSAALKYRFGWTHPIFFAPNSDELLVGSQYVLKSGDGGRTWSRISPDLTRNDPTTEGPTGGSVNIDATGAEVFPDISALAVSPRDGKVMWAGSADGLVHVTRDGGQSWQAVTPPALPEWAEISSIEPSHVAAGTAYLTASRYMWDDFHPYIFETTDYGAHWRAVASGIPDDEYVFVVRQDPADAQLLFAGTRSTAYVSYDGAAHWQPLTRNLPRVQVRDIAIDTRQGEVVVATHGRSFWVLDNLSLLEQVSMQPAVGSGDVQVYAPQTAWLTHAYGSNEFASNIPGAGTNPQFGATVFFHVPASYHGDTPVSLTFLDSKGQVVRTFKLHLKHKEPKLSPPQKDNQTPLQLKATAEEKLTAITAGFNRFQWDLRYPDATEVTGFYQPVAAGGLEDSVAGPSVVPGSYTVVLDYNGQKSQRSFQVALDPRLHPASPGALEARLELELRIHQSLDTLDRTINDAIAMRTRLQAAVARQKVSAAKAHDALAALGRAIDDNVDLAAHSSEGTVVFETKLRSHLAYLAADIDLAYMQPTQAEYQVYDHLGQQAQAGEQQLEAAVAQGRQVL